MPDSVRSDYTPISCSIYDELEIVAMRRTPLVVEYLDAGAVDRREAGLILGALRQRDGAEFAEFERGDGSRLELRLDRIVVVEDAQSSRRTRISPSCAVDATSSPSRVK